VNLERPNIQYAPTDLNNDNALNNAKETLNNPNNASNKQINERPATYPTEETSTRVPKYLVVHELDVRDVDVVLRRNPMLD
jgi:hypothetical protein